MLKIKVTPYNALVVAGIIALLAIIISTNLARHQHWLGIDMVAAEQGLLVESVDDTGSSAGILYVADVIVAISDTQGNRVQLQAQDIIEDPDTIPTFVERNRFRERQSRIYRILQQPVVLLRLEDGRDVRIQPQDNRPLHSLPVSFWLLALYSMIALLVGAAIWAVKQQSVPTRYLLLSGFGVVFLLNSVNIIVVRELALDGAFYQQLAFFYHLGYDMFALGLIGLFWSFPRQLSRFSIMPVLLVYMLFFILNENLEWSELPGNSVLIQVPGYFILSFTSIIAQWFRSRGRPVDRVAVKALALTLCIILIISGYYFFSVLLYKVPVLSFAESFFGIFIIYIGLSLAVIRFRLFDIDRWWIELWLWFFAGAAIIVFDMVLATVVNMAPSYALGVSVIIVAWLYFPLRQWLWAKLFHRAPRSLEEYIPVLMAHFVHVDYADSMQFWKKVLNDVFRPLAIEVRQEAIPNAMIVEDGLRLRTPCLLAGHSIELVHADKGGRLFNSADIKLAQVLFNISKQAMGQREVYMQGILDERKRIMRDLHDDIGGRLLTLTHDGQGKAQTAAEALKSLREIIYSLDAQQQLTVNEAVARWRIEAVERCESANVLFEWHWQELAADIELSPRQLLNLTLTCREGMTNVFKHAQVKSVVFNLLVSDGLLQVKIESNGMAHETKLEPPGRGIRNMRIRIEELGGTFATVYEGGIFCLEFSIPLDKSSGAYDA